MTCEVQTATQMKKLLIVGWVVYFISYIGRLNYSASMLEIGISEGFSLSQLGGIVTAFFISYSIGQLVSGIAGDRFSPKYLVMTGLIISGVCNISMALSGQYIQMIMFWFINGFALAFIWPPMLKLFSMYMDAKTLYKASFSIQTSVALGTCMAYLLSSTLIHFLNWKTVFWCASMLLIITAIGWNIIISKVQATCKINVISPKELMKETQKQTTYEGDTFKSVILKSGLVTLLLAMIIMGFLKDGVMTWIPQYITDTFKTETAFSIFLSSVLPLINLAGIYIARWLNDKNNKNDLMTTIILYCVSLVSLLLLVTVGKYNIYLTVIFFAFVTSCMLGINTILVNVVPTYFAKYNKVSTVAGITNCTTYLGSAICGYGLGSFSEKYGWQATRILLLVVCGLAIISCILSLNKWKKFKREMAE